MFREAAERGSLLAKQYLCALEGRVLLNSIPDENISTSSNWDPNHGPSNSRLGFLGGRQAGWCAGRNDIDQWIKVTQN